MTLDHITDEVIRSPSIEKDPDMAYEAARQKVIDSATDAVSAGKELHKLQEPRRQICMETDVNILMRCIYKDMSHAEIRTLIEQAWGFGSIYGMTTIYDLYKRAK